MLQQKFKRICPVCGKENLKFLPQHLASVHKLSSLDRKPYLKKAKYQGITFYSINEIESLPALCESKTRILPKKKSKVRSGRKLKIYY